MAKLLGNLLWIQEKLLEQNPDTRSIINPGTESSKSTAYGSDNEEEIPSDTEDEKSDEGDDDAEDREDLTSGEQAESSLKLPAKRKHELVSCADFSNYPTDYAFYTYVQVHEWRVSSMGRALNSQMSHAGSSLSWGNSIVFLAR